MAAKRSDTRIAREWNSLALEFGRSNRRESLPHLPPENRRGCLKSSLEVQARCLYHQILFARQGRHGGTGFQPVRSETASGSPATVGRSRLKTTAPPRTSTFRRYRQDAYTTRFSSLGKGDTVVQASSLYVPRQPVQLRDVPQGVRFNGLFCNRSRRILFSGGALGRCLHVHNVQTSAGEFCSPAVPAPETPTPGTARHLRCLPSDKGCQPCHPDAHRAPLHIPLLTR
jgi:hypothetical protein